MATLGRWAGIELPVARGFLAIASAIVGEDLMRAERAWTSLGLEDLDKAGLQVVLQEGPQA